MPSHRPFSPALVVAALLLSRPALAGDAAAAEALFNEAKQLTTAGNWAEACPKFQASYKLDRTLGTLMNLADCHEHVGKIASAWAEWGEAIELLKRASDDRVGFATERRDKLTPRLPKLTVQVAAPIPGLDVYRDDVKIEPGAYNLALPVDPGAHVVSVKRSGTVLESQSVTAEEAQSASVRFDLAAIQQKHPPAKAPSGTANGGGAPERDRPVSSSQKTIGFVVGGVGLVAVATGAGFGIAAIVNKNKADEADACVEQFCSTKGIEAADRAKNFADIGQWVGIGGVVLTAVGATLILTAPSANTARGTGSHVALSPWLDRGGGGVGLSGVTW